MIRREENKQILLVIDKCFRRVTKTFLGQGNVLELGNFHKQSFATWKRKAPQEKSPAEKSSSFYSYKLLKNAL